MRPALALEPRSPPLDGIQPADGETRANPPETRFLHCDAHIGVVFGKDDLFSSNNQGLRVPCLGQKCRWESEREKEKGEKRHPPPHSFLLIKNGKEGRDKNVFFIHS